MGKKPIKIQVIRRKKTKNKKASKNKPRKICKSSNSQFRVRKTFWKYKL